jgi:outer membrane protein assembly factor BamB
VRHCRRKPGNSLMKSISRFAVTVLLSAGLYAGATLGADWPGFRGPHGNGVGDDADLPVPAGADSVRWKVKLPGPGASAPIASNGKLFVTCYTGYGTKVAGGFGKGGFDKGAFGKGGFDKGGFGKGGFGKGRTPDAAELAEQKKLRLVLVCLDGNKGEVLWQKEVEPKLPETTFGGMIREHGYATSTPATDGERVYAFFGKTGVFAFDTDGKQLWHADVGSGLNFFGMAASPLLYRDLVIVNASIESGALIGLDKKTGKEVWRTRNIGASWGAPVLVEIGEGKHEVVLSLPGKIAAFNPLTGAERWHCQGIKVGGIPGYGGTYTSPAAQGGIVYITGGGGPGSTPTTIAVRAGGTGDVNETHVLWRQRAGTSYSSPVVRGDYVYCVDGTVTCLRADTGKVVYKERLYESRGEYISPVIVGDKLVALTRFDGLFVVAAGKEFRQLAAHDFPGDRSIFNAGPAVADGRIYARSNAYLYCLGKQGEDSQRER